MWGGEAKNALVNTKSLPWCAIWKWASKPLYHLDVLLRGFNKRFLYQKKKKEKKVKESEPAVGHSPVWILSNSTI